MINASQVRLHAWLADLLQSGPPGQAVGPALRPLQPSPALSVSTRAPQPLEPAAAATAVEAVEAAVDRRALLATYAATGHPAGVEVDGGIHWRAILGLGLAGRVTGRRDAPVEGARKYTVRAVCESVGRRDARGQGGGCVHAHGARALGTGGGGNGEPLTSGCRPNIRSESRAACFRRLRGGAHGRTSANAEGQQLVLMTSGARFSICDGDRRLGMCEPG